MEATVKGRILNGRGRRMVFPAMCAAGLCAAAILAGGPVAGAAAPPAVTVSENSASIDTFQALNAIDTRSRDKAGSDFISFGESLHPAVLSGTEGTADTFVSLAASVVTPSQGTPFGSV